MNHSTILSRQRKACVPECLKRCAIKEVLYWTSERVCGEVTHASKWQRLAMPLHTAASKHIAYGSALEYNTELEDST